MRYTGLDGRPLSRIGLGTWAMGGGGYLASLGEQSDADSHAVIAAAVEAGINWLDTAPYYGLGHAEELAGQALRSLPAWDRPMIFTKCGVVWDDPGQPSWEVLSPRSIRRQCGDSLRRIGVGEIDLLQIHWPEIGGTPVEESWGAMAELAAAGLTRWIGVSNFDVGLLDRCEAIRHVDTLQPPFSMLRRSAAEQLIPWCVTHGTTVLAYSPLETGMLAGSVTQERVATFGPRDVRLERGEVFTEPQLSRCLELVEALREVAGPLGRSLAELASGWVLSWPGVSAAIVGARTRQQLAGWAGHGSEELPAEVVAQIAVLLEQTGAGVGPVRPTALDGPLGHALGGDA
jgi:aryl-alcohol dehydrogenase-like predicted oxidoreductase